MKKKAEDITILVVDDEKNIREMLAFAIEMEGYQVKTAGDGLEALTLIKQSPIDLVISDIKMPKSDGVELLDKAKEGNDEVPIILMMTGFSEFSIEEAYHRGAEAFFSKPIDTKALFGMIERLLLPDEERWSQEQTEVAVEMNVSIQFSSLDHAIDAKVCSLGRGGMFVSLSPEEVPQINDAVDFKLTPKDGSSLLEGSGIVRWARIHGTDNFPPGCGIEFLYLPDAHRKKIIELITSKNPKAYIPKN